MKLVKCDLDSEINAHSSVLSDIKKLHVADVESTLGNFMVLNCMKGQHQDFLTYLDPDAS